MRYSDIGGDKLHHRNQASLSTRRKGKLSHYSFIFQFVQPQPS
jgi:hypothetical protein